MEEPLEFHKVDLTQLEELSSFFQEFHDGNKVITKVIHLAGLKSVTDSLSNPGKYFEHNVTATLNLLNLIEQHPLIIAMVFASSAAVYGDARSPIKEDIELVPVTPYGATKLKVEHLLQEYQKTHRLDIGTIRYFNPLGVHPSGKLGEQSKNLMPMVLKSLTAKEPMKIFNGIRDYVSVMDVARGCVLVLDYLEANHSNYNISEAWNLGNGVGLSVIELLDQFTAATGITVPVVNCGKRDGDVDVLVSDVSKAKEQLQWTPEIGLGESFKDLWRWYATTSN